VAVNRRALKAPPAATSRSPRLHPADYDAWAAAGNAGWTFEELLPLFRAVQADADFADEWHGADGLIPVSRLRLDDLGPYPRAFVGEPIACGHPADDDHNRSGALGVGPVPRNVWNGMRISTAIAYLAPARARRTHRVPPSHVTTTRNAGEGAPETSWFGWSGGVRRRQERKTGRRTDMRPERKVPLPRCAGAALGSALPAVPNRSR
jgi:hypothetical protein